MLGKALLESMMILNKKAVVSVIRLKEMEFFQAKPSDLDGIVSVLRQTRGVEVAILLYELEPQTFKARLCAARLTAAIQAFSASPERRV